MKSTSSSRLSADSGLQGLTCVHGAHVVATEIELRFAYTQRKLVIANSLEKEY